MNLGEEEDVRAIQWPNERSTAWLRVQSLPDDIP